MGRLRGSGLAALGFAGLLAAGACSEAGQSLLGSACAADDECAGGLACVGGRCLPPECASCPPGEVCNDQGVCVVSLGCGSEPCQSGTFCSVSGECIPDGSCNEDGDCGGGLVCDVDNHACVPGGDCGAQEFVLEGVPPNVMLVVDRTGSMDAEVPGSGMSRWEVASQAIGTLLSLYGDAINWGLVVFSACTGDGCAPGTIVQPIGSSPAAINQEVAQTQLCFSGSAETVIGGTLQALVGEMSLQEPGRDNVVVLLTDGQDNCGGGGPQAAAALLAQTVPVETYVIGFSGDVNATELEAIAQAAGTAPYIQADDAQALNGALQGIAASVASCTYALGSTPEGAIWVFFDDDASGIPNDGSNGWTYDEQNGTITFHGDACDQIKNGEVSDIDVVFGCPIPTPE